MTRVKVDPGMFLLLQERTCLPNMTPAKTLTQDPFDPCVAAAAESGADAAAAACLNGGQCIPSKTERDPGNDFYCECPEGFEGLGSNSIALTTFEQLFGRISDHFGKILGIFQLFFGAFLMVPVLGYFGLVVVYPGWVEYDFGLSIVYLGPPGHMGTWQNRLVKRLWWWNIDILSQPFSCLA